MKRCWQIGVMLFLKWIACECAGVGGGMVGVGRRLRNQSKLARREGREGVEGSEGKWGVTRVVCVAVLEVVARRGLVDGVGWLTTSE